ncbi:hypothetical protein OVA13_11310 [Pseudoxanthomonas sp. SL93]|uniref:hypothetical protein n=1 Tax=Pseudoxanthomonas sp. SL93 TaxID=2995142 RepID=UPI0022714D79|nr:hypothetical protein [Pseudoxanthomonas sp. SL93]WAC61991.1 hypothetical protein OVA13_11310 [Pseudoxanthomonas sp. SL93]
MSESFNPYEAPRAMLRQPKQERTPPAMWVILALYLAHYAFEIIAVYRAPVANIEFFTPIMVTIGVYGVVMCFALWRRQQWARVWLVITTVLTLFLLGSMLWRGVSMARWPAFLAAVLRIAVGALLFLPSVRRWFAPHRA